MVYKKPNFSEEVRESKLEVYSGMCCIDGCLKRAQDFDHGLPNTKANNKLFPLFMQSPFNCFPICREHHEDKAIKITYRLVAVYETYLRKIRIGSV